MRLELLAESIPLIVWTATPDGELDYYNREWERYTGYTTQQTKGWGWAPVIHPDDLQRCVDTWTAAYARGTAYNIEYRLKRGADGAYRWFLGHGSPLRNDSGGVIKWFGVCTDIDDQVRARAVLSDEGSRVASIVDRQVGAIAATNRELIHQDEVRREAMAALEADSARLNEIVTTQFLLAKAQLNLPEFMDLVVTRMARLTPATGVVIEMVERDEMVYRAATGSLTAYVGLRLKRAASLSGLCVQSRNVMNCVDSETDARVDQAACRKVGARSMVVAPLFHAGEAVGVLKILSDRANTFAARDQQTLQIMAGLLGAAIGHQNAYETNRLLLEEQSRAMVALEREIIHRRQIEEAVLANELRTRQIIEGSHDPFIGMNAEGMVTDWNEAASNTFGWSRSDALGQSMETLIIPERYRAAHRAGMQRFLATGDAVALDKRLELTGVRRSGEEFPLEVTIRHMRHAGVVEFCAFLRDITLRRQAEQRLQFLAENDALTGLPNRALLQDRLAEALKRAGRKKSMLAVMFLDVDYFKNINDEYGHGVGDSVLQEFSRRMVSAVRATDTVARLGGDEFVILMEELSDIGDAQTICGKIHERMAEPFQIDAEHAITVTTSIGAATCVGGAMSPEELLKAADEALYRAKQAGRNRTQI